MSSLEDELKQYVSSMSLDERKDLYGQLVSGASGASPSAIQERFGSIPTEKLKEILYDESAKPEIPVYFAFGHGGEVPTEYEERDVLPKGYTLLTQAQCGDITNLYSVQKLIDASRTADPTLLANPTKQFLKSLTGLDYFIYREGDKIPPVKFTPFTALPDYDVITISGVHKLPIQPEIEAGKMLIPLKKLAEQSDKVFTKSTVFPKPEKIKEYLQTTSYTEYPLLEFSKIMKLLGPGTYYFPICRTLPAFSTAEYQKLLEVLTVTTPVLKKSLEALVGSQNDSDKLRKTLYFVLTSHLKRRGVPPEEKTAIQTFLNSINKNIEFIERTRSKSTLRQQQIAGLRKNGKKKTRRRRYHGVQSRKHHN